MNNFNELLNKGWSLGWNSFVYAPMNILMLPAPFAIHPVFCSITFTFLTNITWQYEAISKVYDKHNEEIGLFWCDKKIVAFSLFEKEVIEGKMEGDWIIFYLLVHSLNAYNGWT